MRFQFARLLMLLTLSVGLHSCETDKSRMAKCNAIVQSFIANLPLDNYEILYKNYPDFQKVKRYWKVNDFKITNATIDDDKTVSIIGTSRQLGNILFNLKEINGKYFITNSKGLASVFNTPLYKYCKKIGCIGLNDYDKDISQTCSDKEDEFKSLVYQIKNNIQENVMVQNHNLSISFGYVSGDVTVKNYSRFSIPGRGYELYYHFLNNNGDIVFTKKEILNFESIPYGQSVTHHLFESSTRNFDRIKAELKLITTDFIEEIIAENIKGSNCQAGNNF
ncbi:MAG: hypothetical protein ACK5DG_09815 [Chitinophagaceae bacterium]